MKKYFDMMGKPAVDRVTKFSGIIESVSFDLYGCVQFIVRPLMNEKGELGDGRWFDAKRLEVTGDAVMEVPSFGTMIAGTERGGCDKPIR